jgi:4'-phosphopantetheinyl transferase
MEFLTSRLAAKHAIARTLAEVPEPLARFEVRHQPGGAPAPFVDGAPAPLAISMSDRAGWAACVTGVDPGLALGIDVELVEPRTDGFVRDWFTPGEARFVAAATTDDDRQVRANLVWSAKESALKVLRTGLRRDTRSVEVSVATTPPTSSWQALTVLTQEGTSLPGWWCRLGSFLVTVTADHEHPPPRAFDASEPRLAVATPRHSWLAEPLAEGHG